MVYRYRAHGLTIAAEFDLALRPDVPNGDRPDITVRWGRDRCVPPEDPRGTLLARLATPDGTLRYALGRGPGFAVLRFPGLCDFVGDPRMAAVTVHLHPGADPALVPVLAAGALLAVHLKLRRALVLHASAVRLGDAALAFVGASGMGKSTLAALVCAGGHDLLTDDVLRVETATGGAAAVHPGSIECRLRPAAGQLADGAPAGAVRPTADGRLALRQPARTGEPLPLLACVVPLPHRRCDGVEVRRLPRSRALMRMLQFPRLLGWLDPESAAAEFQALADLVEQVPVFDASIPWGPPFRAGVADELLAEVARQR